MEKVLKFTKGDAVKFCFERFEAELVSLGWVCADKPAPKPEAPAVEPVAVDEAPAVVVDDFEDTAYTKEELIARAKELGLAVDGRFGEARLLELIEEAEAAMDMSL